MSIRHWKTLAAPSIFVLAAFALVAIAQVLGNVPVNDPAQDHTTADTQSETAIVLGAAPNVLVAFNDSGAAVGGAAHFTGFALSTNGGGAFVDRGALPNSPGGDAGDPVAARDSQTGAIYLSTLISNGTGSQVFRSTNNGQTFLPPVNGAPGFAGGDFLDKEWIAVDNFAGPGQGNVYLVFRDFPTGLVGSRPPGIYLTRSTNQGAAWGPNGGNLVVGAGAGNVQGAFVAVGPAHDVYVFWYDQNAGAGTAASLRVRRSTDQGQNFGAPVVVAPLRSVGVNGEVNLNGGFRTNGFPHAAVNPANGNLYVVFNNMTAGHDLADIFLTQSQNHGQAWSAPVRVNDDATPNDQWAPTVSVAPDGAHLFVGFYDRRLSANNTLIDYFGAVATVAGANVTFQPNFRINTQAFPSVIGQDPSVNPTYMGDYDQSAADANFFYVPWADNRLGNAFHAHQPDVRLARIPITGIGTPIPTGTEVLSCNRACPNLTKCYGVGELTVSPQFCSVNGGAAAPVTVPASTATDTGLVAAGGAHIFQCNRFCSSLGSCYGIGVLTTLPQFCSANGATPAAASVAASVATDTGLRTAPGAQPVFRCNLECPNLGFCYGIGILTTRPQFCSTSGPTPPPAVVAPTIAKDTGLRSN